MHFIRFKSIPSTNTHALELLKQACKKNMPLFHLNKTIITAESQTNGKGRLNRYFYSPSTGIYMSIIYVPRSPITNTAILTACTSIAIVRSLKKLFQIDVNIKWVNDIYFNNKKVAGILTEGFINPETQDIQAAVIGIGINLNTENFPLEIQESASSLNIQNSKRNKNKLSKQIAKECFRIYKKQTNIKNALKEYKSLQLLIGKNVEISPVINQTNQNYCATVLDVSDDAELIVKLSDGTVKKLFSGEVTLHQN